MKNDYRKALGESEVIAFVPGGNSMWPFIKGGKQSVIVTRKKDRLSLFDVALFERKDGSAVFHRVVEVLPDGYVMQGDSQDYVETVSEGDVLGVLQGFYRGKKYVDVTESGYLIKVAKWYRRKKRRKIKLWFFRLKLRIKNKLKRIFAKKEKTDELS